jgi:hypothetical protein
MFEKQEERNMMDTEGEGPNAGRRGFTDLLGRAITDSRFRELLQRDRASAVEGYNLSATDIEALDKLLEQGIEAQVQLFSSQSGSALAIGIGVGVGGSFAAS